ncbi:FliH/SctL family protein [Pseudoalteromonas prydzensis]|uniref:FliH/SctL family protein n=1 Tax=Pseudoalteromonas prydzensis TaxID=182141 RepID=UPI0007E5252E|nr:FliH/SctL family protein [Pseudoalteromonas prydzensis]MBE0378088.1 hypothetical protein [Pseudoalteromonas prydzensis ACAM 620]
MQAFRFPTLTKAQQHQSVQQRIDAAEQLAWQKGFDDGLQQGKAMLQTEIEKHINERAEALLNAREHELKQQLTAQFEVLCLQFKQQFNIQSNEVLKDISVLVAKVAERVIASELQLQPQCLIDLVEQALSLLAGRDEVHEIVFSAADADLIAQTCFENSQLKVSFEHQLASGTVKLISSEQSHSLSLTERLDAVFTEITPALMNGSIADE